MAEIDGMHFTGFAGLDRQNLLRLNYAGRVEWLKHRIELVFMRPFKKMVALEHECYVWLCVTNLLCAAVEALADFEFGGSGMERFSRFVEKYFDPEFQARALRLDEPRPKPTAAATPAEHLYRYFRCGLAHSFCIEWGGLLHREDGAPAYLFEREPMGDGRHSLGIVPRELVADFLRAVEKFFQTAKSWQAGSAEANRFDQQFAEIFLVCAAPTT